MPELKALIEEHKPSIIAITEVMPKKYRFPVQKAEVKLSDEYEVFPECISSKRRRIIIQVRSSLRAQEIKLKITFDESVWCEIKQAPNQRIFERRLDQYWRQHDLKYNFRGVVNCRSIANQWTNKCDTCSSCCVTLHIS